jgi:hypothetical protein
LVVKSDRKLITNSSFVRDLDLGCEILVVSDILLESIIIDSIGAFERLLNQFGKFVSRCGLGVKGEEGGLKVFLEFGKGLLGGRNVRVEHSIVPHVGKGYSSSLAHLVQCCNDLVVVCGVNGRVKDKVGLYGLDPSHGICGFSREIGKEGCLQFNSLGGHGWD